MQMRPPARNRTADTPPDLQTQLEALLHAVWLAEAEWRLDERIDLATRGPDGTSRRGLAKP